MEVYEGYSIHVQRISDGRYKAFSNSGDEYVDDNEKKAIAGLKGKIDNIAKFRAMQEESKRTKE
ncbi:hypothetical protein [Paenibacillus amylolyticus]|uniref:CRE-SIN-3 protein n=1 Tax=Paenibacillus amylolyticus TaxID=1451 RepID=A0A100VMC8_PAEAM|nr:hypothetical protein [Paenibacillus amylolyticus]GAS82408.1 CRE-SIN-3 protein [Paenibacillus amylolyticus]